MKLRILLFFLLILLSLNIVSASSITCLQSTGEITNLDIANAQDTEEYLVLNGQDLPIGQSLECLAGSTISAPTLDVAGAFTLTNEGAQVLAENAIFNDFKLDITDTTQVQLDNRADISMGSGESLSFTPDGFKLSLESKSIILDNSYRVNSPSSYTLTWRHDSGINLGFGESRDFTGTHHIIIGDDQTQITVLSTNSILNLNKDYNLRLVSGDTATYNQNTLTTSITSSPSQERYIDIINEQDQPTTYSINSPSESSTDTEIILLTRFSAGELFDIGDIRNNIQIKSNRNNQEYELGLARAESDEDYFYTVPFDLHIGDVLEVSAQQSDATRSYFPITYTIESTDQRRGNVILCNTGFAAGIDFLGQGTEIALKSFEDECQVNSCQFAGSEHHPGLAKLRCGRDFPLIEIENTRESPFQEISYIAGSTISRGEWSCSPACKVSIAPSSLVWQKLEEVTEFRTLNSDHATGLHTLQADTFTIGGQEYQSQQEEVTISVDPYEIFTDGLAIETQDTYYELLKETFDTNVIDVAQAFRYRLGIDSEGLKLIDCCSGNMMYEGMQPATLALFGCRSQELRSSLYTDPTLRRLTATGLFCKLDTGSITEEKTTLSDGQNTVEHNKNLPANTCGTDDQTSGMSCTCPSAQTCTAPDCYEGYCAQTPGMNCCLPSSPIQERSGTVQCGGCSLPEQGEIYQACFFDRGVVKAAYAEENDGQGAYYLQEVPPPDTRRAVGNLAGLINDQIYNKNHCPDGMLKSINEFPPANGKIMASRDFLCNNPQIDLYCPDQRPELETFIDRAVAERVQWGFFEKFLGGMYDDTSAASKIRDQWGKFSTGGLAPQRPQFSPGLTPEINARPDLFIEKCDFASVQCIDDSLFVCAGVGLANDKLIIDWERVDICPFGCDARNIACLDMPER